MAQNIVIADVNEKYINACSIDLASESGANFAVKYSYFRIELNNDKEVSSKFKFMVI